MGVVFKKKKTVLRESLATQYFASYQAKRVQPNSGYFIGEIPRIQVFRLQDQALSFTGVGEKNRRGTGTRLSFASNWKGQAKPCSPTKETTFHTRL